MFKSLEESDYFLPLLDPELKAHKRYTRSGTSGSFQLIYGFLKPCIIHKTFADIYGFDTSNALIYEDNSKISEKMHEAINTTEESYLSIQNNLKTYVGRINNLSLNNLKRILMMPPKKIPIVFAFDDNYALPASIAIKSLLDTKKDGTEYEIIVFHGGLKKKTIKKFSTIANIRWIKVEENSLRMCRLAGAGLQHITACLSQIYYLSMTKLSGLMWMFCLEAIYPKSIIRTWKMRIGAESLQKGRMSKTGFTHILTKIQNHIFTCRGLCWLTRSFGGKKS